MVSRHIADPSLQPFHKPGLSAGTREIAPKCKFVGIKTYLVVDIGFCTTCCEQSCRFQNSKLITNIKEPGDHTVRSVASEPGERIGVNHTSLQLKLSAVREIDTYNHPKLCQSDVEIAAGIVEAALTSLSYT